MQHHLSAGVQRLTRSAYMEHHWAERLPLPDSVADSEIPAGAALTGKPTPDAVLDLARLGTLLNYSVGGRSILLNGEGYHLQRFTASGGNLGSAELYIVALDVSGLAQGIYHYLIIDHTLEVLQRGSFVGDLADCLSDSTDQDVSDFLDGVAAVLVIVSAVERVCTKYSERGYMYCLLDAGLVAHRLDLLARQLGLHIRLAWHFADQSIAGILGVDGLRLAPSLLVALEQGQTRTSPDEGGLE
jgi:SagB-type dehydrogenase family enzyme